MRLTRHKGSSSAPTDAQNRTESKNTKKSKNQTDKRPRIRKAINKPQCKID